MSCNVIDGGSETQRSRCIHALVLAFIRDPMMRWLYPEPEAYLSHFPGFARAFGGPAFRSGTAWLSDDLGGAALWFPSGVAPDGESIVSHLLDTLDERRHPVVHEVLSQMDAHHPHEPHWYLAIIGVDAAHQGKGLGAKLLQGALKRCDEEGLPAYLESSNPANLSLYERHGFRVTGEIRGDGTPPMFPMLRPARSIR
jgi:ribosomal protein S18 acetylase RimI-like enzyme